MSAFVFRCVVWLLLSFAVCNVSQSQKTLALATDNTATTNPRLLAAVEAKAIEELRRLAESDPSRIHATTLKTHNRMGWKWLVYLPPGKDWVVKGAVGRIPGRGRQPQERDTSGREIVRVDQSRIVALEGHISRTPFDGWSLIVEADQSVFSAVEFAEWNLGKSPDREEVADYVTGKREAASLTMFSGDIGRVTTKVNDELELVRWRYEPKVDPPEPGPDRRLPRFVLWIEAK